MLIFEWCCGFEAGANVWCGVSVGFSSWWGWRPCGASLSVALYLLGQDSQVLTPITLIVITDVIVVVSTLWN